MKPYLEAIRERCAAVVTIERYAAVAQSTPTRERDEWLRRFAIGYIQELCASIRQDIPALLAYVEKLEKVLSMAVELLDNLPLHYMRGRDGIWVAANALTQQHDDFLRVMEGE